MFKPKNPVLDNLLKATASVDEKVAKASMQQFATALELPLRQGVMSGPLLGDIFEQADYSGQRFVEYPLDFLAPGSEANHTAFTVPQCGFIPHNTVEGDYVLVPTYDVANSIDWCLHYAENANWNVVDRAMQVFRDGFVKKLNDDGSHVMLAAGLDRNAVVYDSAAAAGQFTKRLVSLMKVFMRRNSGGNSTSTNKGRMTDLIISPEAEEDIRNWGLSEVDDITRRQIFTSAEGLTSVFQVNLHSWEEFGVGAELELYYENVLGGTLPAGDVEIVLGLDLSAPNSSFVMPVRKQLQVYEDVTLLRAGRAGVWGRMSLGFAVLDSRATLLGSL